VQPETRADASDRDRDNPRHSWRDPFVQKYPASRQVTDILQVVRTLISAPAPTEPQVTDVTSTSTSGVGKCHDQGIPTGVEIEPAARLAIHGDGE